MQEFRDILAWQRSHAIALAIYRLTRDFPTDERYGVVQQMRRAAVSVPTNIAEGSKRLFRRDYVRFLNVAEASLREVEYLLLLARDLGYGQQEGVAGLLREVEVAARVLAGLRKAVQKAEKRGARNRSSRLPTPDSTPNS